MLHRLDVPPAITAIALLTFFVLLPIAALVFANLVLGFLALR
jgi:hypothetical protein